MNAKQKLHQQNLAMWNDRFQDQAQSGLSVKKWCILNNISIHAYNYWKHIAKEEYLDSILPDIVPLAAPSDPLPDYSLETIPTVMPTIAASVSSESSDSRNSRNKLEMSFGDIHIEFGPSASDELILSIIKAVRYA